MMEKIREVFLYEKFQIKKEIIYVKIEEDLSLEERDKEVMKAITLSKNEFFKFNSNGIKGAETIKNDTHLWCDFDKNIWQVCCGNVRDLHNNDIPNTFYVRKIGIFI